MSWHKWMLGTICHCCDCAGEQVTSVGGRKVRICNEHANEFHAWLTGQAIFKAHRLLQAEELYLSGLCAVGNPVSHDTWETYGLHLGECNDELFRVTGVWLEEHKRLEGETESEPDPETEQQAVPPMNYGRLVPPVTT